MLVIGCHEYPASIKNHELNWQTWQYLSNHFSKIEIIAQSRDYHFHHDKIGSVSLYLCPKIGVLLVDIIIFYLFAMILSMISLSKGTRIIEISELVAAGPIAVLLSKLWSITLLSHVQGETITAQSGSYPAEILIRAISKWVCINSSRIRVVNDAIRRDIIELGIPDRKVYRIYSAVNTDLFCPKGRKERKNAIPRPFKFLYVGSLLPVKNIQTLIKAFTIVKERIGYTKLDIVGSGPEKPALVRLARRLGVYPLVEFHGRISHTRLPTILRESDVLVLPSISEGMPRVILESMACGTPVIATKVGGIPEIIRSGETGILVPPRSPMKLAEAMLKIANKPRMAHRIAEVALETIVNNHSHINILEKRVDFIKCRFRG